MPKNKWEKDKMTKTKNVTVKVNAKVKQKLINSYSPGSDLQKFVDISVEREVRPFVPQDTTALAKSVILNTDFGSGQLIWSIYGNPDGRNTWNDNTSTFQGAPMRGSRWAERWANGGGREVLSREIRRFING